ncbi:MAG: hypothetical protein AB1925_15670 [Actinomycetota bacterium]
MVGSASSPRRRRRPQAGRKLRASLDQAQAATAEDLGYELEWSEEESLIIDRAAAAADRAEVLQRQWDEELAGEARATLLVKLSAEMRACEKAVVDLVKQVNPGEGRAKSARHQTAATARWGIRGVVS